MRVSLMVADVRFLGIYTCISCRREEVGTTACENYRALSVEQLVSALRSTELRAHDMPVGWASYSEGFRCGECKI